MRLTEITSIRHLDKKLINLSFPQSTELEFMPTCSLIEVV